MPAFDPLTLIGIDVNGATLGIVGMGRIGGAVATRASAAGMRVRYHNRRRADREYAADYVAALPDLLAQSDFLTLH